MAYARRKRLQRAWEAARARAARAAWDAADRARRLALIQAVARGRAKHPPRAPSPTDDTPPPRAPHLLLDGEVPLDEAASDRVPQPGPSRPDGSYTPHGLRDGFAPARPIDLAAWKQQDYNRLARHQAAEAADRAFDAEVGWPTQQEWLTAQGYATALRTERVLEDARQVCNPPYSNFNVVSCNVAQTQAQQKASLLGIEAALHPHASWEPSLPPPQGSLAVGIHASGGLPGWYVDGGIYLFSVDTRGHFSLFQ